MTNTINESVEKIVSSVKSELESGNDVQACFFFGDEGYVPSEVPIPNTAMSPDLKDSTSNVLHELVAEVNPDFCIFMSDTWVKKVAKEEDYEKLKKQYGEIRLMPDRAEAIILVIETKEKSSTRQIVYSRDGNKINYLSDTVTEHGDGDGIDGRFANFYKNKN